MLIASCPAYINPKWYKKDHWEGFLSTFPMARMKIKSDLQQLPDPLSLQDGMASNAPLASPQLISSLGLAITRHGGTAHGTASFERGLRLRKRAEDASAWLGFKLWIMIFWVQESHDSCLLLFSLANPCLLFLLATFTTLTIEENVLPPRWAVCNGSVVSIWPTSEPITLKPKKKQPASKTKGILVEVDREGVEKVGIR